MYLCIMKYILNIKGENKMKKKCLGILLFLLIFVLNVSAQRQIDNVPFMVEKAKTMEALDKKFGTPYLLSNGKATYKNVVFDGEKYNEIECFFDNEWRLNQLRLKTCCNNKVIAVARMNRLAKKYEQSYNTTNSENADDGKFVVGYNNKDRIVMMIATYKNNCDLSFSLF